MVHWGAELKPHTFTSEWWCSSAKDVAQSSLPRQRWLFTLWVLCSLLDLTKAEDDIKLYLLWNSSSECYLVTTHISFPALFISLFCLLDMISLLDSYCAERLLSIHCGILLIRKIAYFFLYQSCLSEPIDKLSIALYSKLLYYLWSF